MGPGGDRKDFCFHRVRRVAARFQHWTDRTDLYSTKTTLLVVLRVS